MNLIETKNSYLIKDFFTPNVVAGFSKPGIAGNMPEDIFTILGKTLPYAWMKQIHGPIIHNIYKEGKYEGDGLFTPNNNLVLVVRTADCVPILLAGDGKIAAIHMGWRSAQTGILDNLPADMSCYKVVIGPCMRECCFQVQDDFYQYKNFVDYISKRGERLYFDPIAFARDNFFRRGLRDDNLADTGICTICGGKGLPSFRKDKTERRILNFILCQEK